MTTIYVIRTFGGTLILHPGPPTPLPTLFIVANFRDGNEDATFRNGNTLATFRDGDATGESR